MATHTTIRKLLYTIRHTYLTFNNVVILVACIIALSWIWGSLQAMQRNFALQREVDQKQQQLQITQLQRDSLELQKRYYQTDEYRELAARESLGLVMPGESVVILPPNSPGVLEADAKASTTPTLGAVDAGPEQSNIEQWMNFLFGGYSQGASSGRE